MMEKGIRHNEGKPQWSLIPMKALEPGVRVLMEGAKKYGTNNWRKGLLTREICESMLRHIYSYLDGEDNDSESGQPHVGHIIANAIFLSDMHLTRPDMDNRFLKEKQCCGKWDEYGKCTCADNRGKTESPNNLGDKTRHIEPFEFAKEERPRIANLIPGCKDFRVTPFPAEPAHDDSQNSKKGRSYSKENIDHLEEYYQKTVFNRDPVTEM